MLVLVMYDIRSDSVGGQKSLQKAARVCLKWDCRVQDSVYECEVNNDQFEIMKQQLLCIIKPDVNSVNSLRYYRLGNHYEQRIEKVGMSQFSVDNHKTAMYVI